MTTNWQLVVKPRLIIRTKKMLRENFDHTLKINLEINIISYSKNHQRSLNSNSSRVACSIFPITGHLHIIYSRGFISMTTGNPIIPFSFRFSVINFKFNFSQMAGYFQLFLCQILEKRALHLYLFIPFYFILGLSKYNFFFLIFVRCVDLTHQP